MRTYFFFSQFQQFFLFFFESSVNWKNLDRDGALFTSHCPVIVFVFWLFGFLSYCLIVTGKQISRVFRIHSSSFSPHLCFHAFRRNRFGRWRNCITRTWQARANTNIQALWRSHQAKINTIFGLFKSVQHGSFPLAGLFRIKNKERESRWQAGGTPVSFTLTLCLVL